MRSPHQNHHHMQTNKPAPLAKLKRRSSALTPFIHMIFPLHSNITLHFTRPALHFTSSPHQPRQPVKPAYPPHERPVGPRTPQMSKQNAGRSILIMQGARCRAEFPKEGGRGCGLARCVDLILTPRHVPKSPQPADLLGRLRIISSSQKAFSLRMENVR